MERSLTRALVAGCERVAAWADLLDEINVFPVADGDTGRNLKISLACLGRSDGPAGNPCRQLVGAATGNSGNIAAAFFARFLSFADHQGLGHAVSEGRSAAWKAVADPRPGTMLTLFDALDRGMARWPATVTETAVDDIIGTMDEAVRVTVLLLPALKRAGVVDAGALGMFIFFEGFFRQLTGGAPDLVPVTRRFDGLLRVAGDAGCASFPGYCVNTLLTSPADTDLCAMAAGLGESVVSVPDGDRVRLHLHTPDQQETRARLEAVGEIVDWQAEPMACGEPALPSPAGCQAVHVMTDAAGSLTRAEARKLGVTLLDSTLIVDERRLPETLFEARQLYSAMAAGRRVSTAQASVFQNHQSYESALGRHDQVLYLTVGSVYTGNFATASRWQQDSGTGNRFTVIDTGAASGRLGLIVRMVARAARSGGMPGEVAQFAGTVIDACGELLFLDQLRFLAAGGRISRSKGFFGDLLGIRPVISPAADGAVKVGTVHRAADQVPFALGHLKQRFSPEARLNLLLQFSDNEQRVREAILPEIQRQFPRAQIAVSRLSLTSGAHMGPGTWGVAYCPDLIWTGH